MRDENNLQALKCKECGFIFLEEVDLDDRYADVPICPDCNGEAELYDGELPEELERCLKEMEE